MLSASYIDNRGLFEQLEAEDERVRIEAEEKKAWEQHERIRKYLTQLEADRQRAMKIGKPVITCVQFPSHKRIS